MSIPDNDMKIHKLVDTIVSSRTRHFSDGLSFYMLFWAFFIGSFLGVLIEFLHNLIVRNLLYNPAGLVYGPFNLVYGLGALAMTYVLYQLRKHNFIIILLAGMLIGGSVEVICSWLQEKIFGSVSWNYVDMPYNISGRTSLKLSFYWGIIAILWIKYFYPYAIRGIQKIPNRFAKPLTWALLLFMIINILMSGLAVLRWSERLQGETADSRTDIYFDEHYPDNKMKAMYPNMHFLGAA